MSDYKVTLKVQNGRLWSAMRDINISSIAELCRKAGMGRAALDDVINFKRSPLGADGAWLPSIVRVCTFMGVHPEDIFPGHLRAVMPSNVAEAFVDNHQLRGVSAPCQLYPGNGLDKQAVYAAIDTALAELTPMQRGAVEAIVMHGKTYSEAAKQLKCSHTRPGQLAFEGMKRLRKYHKRELQEAMDAVKAGIYVEASREDILV